MNFNSSPKSNGRQSGKTVLRLTVATLLILGLLAGAFYTVRAISAKKEGAPAPLLAENQFAQVKRGPLVISLNAPGQIKARRSTEIRCAVRGDLKVTWVVDEGAVVKKGDKLIELEASQLLEDTVKQRVTVAQAKAEFEQAKQNVEDQKSKNYSDTIIAQNKFDMAVIDLEKYINGDYKQLLCESDSAIRLAEAELKRATERVDGTQKLLAKGYVNKGDMEADLLDKTKCEIELSKAQNAKELLEKYTYKRETSSLSTAKEGANEELKRTKKSAEATLANMLTLQDSAKARLELEQYQLNQYEEQLKNTVLYAPQGGMVVYCQEDNEDPNSRLRMGGMVHNRQKLMELPDFSAWMIETRINESQIEQVKLEQKVKITIDAFQGRALMGSVAHINVLPDNTRWFMPDSKEYLIQVDVSSTTLPLKPGMNVKTEVQMDNLKDVLYIPVQAITAVDGKATVYVRSETGLRPQLVEVGLNNDRFAEIRSGLREGDQVALGTTDASGNITSEGQKDKAGDKGAKAKGGKTADEKDGKAPAQPAKQAAAGGEANKAAAAQPASGGENKS